MIERRFRNRDAAAAIGVDGGPRKHADLDRRISRHGQSRPAELGAAIDLRRNEALASRSTADGPSFWRRMLAKRVVLYKDWSPKIISRAGERVRCVRGGV